MYSRCITSSALAICLSFLLPAVPRPAAAAAGSSFEIDLNELPKVKRQVPEPRKQAPPATLRQEAQQPRPASPAQYTVKPGDHIFKILMKDFGLSNSQAEALLPAIAELNNLSDIKRLRVGQILLIPTSATGRTMAKKSSTKSKPAAVRETATADKEPAPPVEPATDFIPPPTSKTEPQVKEVPLSAPLPPVVPASVEIHAITAVDTSEIVDRLLELLNLQVSKNRIVESGRDTTDGTYISIKVDRFFSNRGTDYIVAIGVTDPFNMTLLRLLEVEGTQVVTLQPGQSLATIAGKILDKLQWPYTYGKQQLKLSSASDQLTEIDGVMVVTDGATPRQLLITDKQLPQK